MIMNTSLSYVVRSKPCKDPRSLEDLVLEVVASNFIAFAPRFHEIFTDVQRQKLFRIIPTNIPLQVISSVIPDGIFWKRSCYDHWNPSEFTFQYKNSWKNLYMEIFLQTYIQDAYPNNINLIELKEILELVKEYVFSLHIENLQTVEIPGREDFPTRRIDLRPILLSLTNLTEFSIRARSRDKGSKFAAHFFQLTDHDCSNIARGLQKSNNLTSFKMHQTKLDEQKMGTICSLYSSLTQLEHVELTSCSITNDSLKPLIEIVTRIPLRTLVLTNNRIGPEGCSRLASILLHTKLEVLDLRLNFIRDVGVCALFSSMQAHSTLRTVILAGCKITSLAKQDLINLIEKNRSIEELDMNCNDLKDLSSVSMIEILTKNPTLRKLHLKMNDIPPQQKEAIDAALKLKQ